MSSYSGLNVIKVLHVDDDTDHMLISKRMLEKFEPTLQIEPVSSTEEAMRMAESFDCVVSDYQMPKMNGIQLAMEIRKTCNTPIIIYTGRGSEEVAEKAFSVGINDYIRKEYESSHYQVLAKRIKMAVENHRAEERLQASERRLRNTLDNMLEGCQIISPDWRYLYVNDAVAKHGRREKEELLGNTMMEMYPGIDDTEMFQVLRRCMEERTHERMENEFEYHDGNKAWFELSFEPVPEGVFILSIDITERKRAEKALRESEEKLRNIFAASPDAITVSDLNGRIVDCNQATLEMHGFSSKEEVIGMSAFEFIAEKDHERAMENLRKTLEEGVVRDLEYTFLSKDGHEFPAELSASVIKGSSGNPTGFVAVTKNITDRK